MVLQYWQAALIWETTPISHNVRVHRSLYKWGICGGETVWARCSGRSQGRQVEVDVIIYATLKFKLNPSYIEVKSFFSQAHPTTLNMKRPLFRAFQPWSSLDITFFYRRWMAIGHLLFLTHHLHSTDVMVLSFHSEQVMRPAHCTLFRQHP